MAKFILIVKTLLPLILGVALFFIGAFLIEFALVSLTESASSDVNIPGIILSILLGFGVISLTLGILFLAIHFYVMRKETSLYLPDSTTTLALNVAVEFLLGAWLAVVGIDNFDADAGSEGLPWTLAAITVLGLLLVTDSLLLYRRDFKKGVGKKKGV